MGYGAVLGGPEGDAVLAILRGEPASRPPIDERALLKLAEAHGLAGVLAEANGVPPAVRDLARAQEAWVRSHLAAAREVGAALDAAGVRHVFVKGAALALRVYDRPGLRSFGDLDVLAEERDMPRAAQALAAAGFVRLATPPNPMQVQYYRASSPGVTIDLHWAFMSEDSLLAPIRVPVPEILGRALEGAFRAPCDEDSLLLAAAHLVRSCVPTMIHIVDFQRLAPCVRDWGEVVARARAWGLKGCTWLALRLAVEFCRARVPAEVLARLAPAPWIQSALLGLLDRRRVWGLARSRDVRYRFVMKVLCLDRAGDVLRACVAAPLGGLRRLGLLGTSRR